MKGITKELIDKAIAEVGTELMTNVQDQFTEACDKIPEELKDNPMVYHAMAIVTAQCNTINVMKEVLYKLLVD